MKALRHIYIIILIWLSMPYVFSSCNCNSREDKSDHDMDAGDLIEYAKYFSVIPYHAGYNLKVKDPWKNGEICDIYLYPDSLKLPEELENRDVLRTPIKSLVAYSSTQWSVFQQLGEIDKVRGILESHYTQNEEIRHLIDSGLIQDVGTETSLNIEKIIDIQPDVILFTPYQAISRNDISELTGAVMLPFADYVENHPLGRAEWLKVAGYLTGREQDTDEWFKNIVTCYESMRIKCDSVDIRPTVFSDLPFEGQWYIAGGKSYIAQLFDDAGADYIWKDNNSSASVPVDAETVLAKASDADYWKVMNSTHTPYSYRRLSIENELFTHFKAFKERKIIVCDVVQSGYFEKSQYEPDILLMDFINAFHPELTGYYTPKYFRRMIDDNN